MANKVLVFVCYGFLIQLAAAVDFSIKPLNYTPHNGKIDVKNIFAVDINGLEVDTPYRLKTNKGEALTLIRPSYMPEKFRVYLAQNKEKHIENGDKLNNVFVLENMNNQHRINQELHLNSYNHYSNIYDDLIEDFYVIPVNEFESLADNDTIYFQDFLIKMTINLNGHIYNLKTNDNDWGWIYNYLYFFIVDANDNKKLISNLKDNPTVYLIKIGQKDNFPLYRLYSDNLKDIKLLAQIDTFSATFRRKIFKSAFKGKPISLYNRNKENDKTIKASLLHNVPIILQFNHKCNYNSEFLNSKLIFELDYNKHAAFKFNKKIPDTNAYDNKLEIFTTSIAGDHRRKVNPLSDTQLIIGKLELKPSKQNAELLDIKIYFDNNPPLNNHINMKVESKEDNALDINLSNRTLEALTCNYQYLNEAIYLKCACD